MGKRRATIIRYSKLSGIRTKFKLRKDKPTDSSDIVQSISLRKVIETKKIALRRGIWFKALSRIERSIIDLTVRYVENIRSQKLAKIVTAIVEKLQTARENTLDRLVRTTGLPLARKISAVAVRLGNHSAASWAEDLSFAKYLAMSSSRVLA